MIYTVTFNPSIDYIAKTEKFLLGETNRTNKELIYPGGKGINVSIVLHNLGIESVSLGFIAGFTGDEIDRQLNAMGINSDFIHLSEGCSRINVKIKTSEENSCETELNGMGPAISEEDINYLQKRISKLSEGDILVLSGSVPPSISKDIYSKLCKLSCEKGVKVIVDATGELLTNCLEYNPFLIKPNLAELEMIFDVTITDRKQVIEYASKLQNMGAKNVIVSMGADGAIFVSEEGKVMDLNAPKGELVNSVGAGDSMVAGFILGLYDDYAEGITCDTIRNADKFKRAFYASVCTGSASAFKDGFATISDVNNLINSFMGG